MKMEEVNKSKLSPAIKQYIEIKENYSDAFLFFRLGDFYEMFFEDATKCSHILELTLTSKNAGLEERIPMCGVPYHAAETYIEKLVNLGFKVAVCEQVEEAKNVKGIVKREVVQVITKGTIMNNNFLDEKENSFIGSVYDFNHAYVLSYSDITTGEFYTILIDYNVDVLVSEIVKRNIRELIVNSTLDKKITETLRNKYKILVSITDEVNENSDLIKSDDIRLVTGVNHLLAYLIATKKNSLNHLMEVKVLSANNYLKMDIHTKRNLDLIENSRTKEKAYSLLWLLDKTKTAMGSRMLKKWIENPLVNVIMINERLKKVETLLNEFIIREDLRNTLYEIYDLERLVGRISYGNTNGKDMLQLRNSLRCLPTLKSLLKNIGLDIEMFNLEELQNLLEESISEEAPLSIKEGSIIKRGYCAELDELKDLRKGGKDFLLEIEQKEKLRTGIKTLKVGYNRIFGYYIEISKGQKSLVKDEFGYERKQTLANAERYITKELKEKEELILGAEEKIVMMEYDLFITIRDTAKKYISFIQAVAFSIAEIDVLTSFAVSAEENNFTKPEFCSENKIMITDSRHPIIEKVIESEFVSNDIVMDDNTNILLITGPNMAGKSTYMRQLALTVIMAEIGSYVPASSCIIPVIDAIFTRIGASDDLVSGESTFMVEMIEASRAINEATKNSLILFDELGRGTATYDGMSLAESIIEYIHDFVCCKTLFSTHYHELTNLSNSLGHLKNIHVSAHEEDGNITFLHKIKEGAVDKSYGIGVAKLANLPTKVIDRATILLKSYEKKTSKKEEYVQMTFPLDNLVKEENIIENKLKSIDVLSITPIEALNILAELKNSVKK